MKIGFRYCYAASKHSNIDECATQMHYCQSNTACVNLPGSHRCDCLPGFIRVDEYSCTEDARPGLIARLPGPGFGTNTSSAPVYHSPLAPPRPEPENLHVPAVRSSFASSVNEKHSPGALSSALNSL
ncbi:Protein kinase C-binding protein NELL1, partial [Nibea albiflora]